MLSNIDLKRASNARTAAISTQPTPMVRVPVGLLSMMQQLSHARTLDSVVELVREQARELVQSDGVAFVLRDGDQCHYVEENAIGPLWKGLRFPMTACISGWSMMHKQAVSIQDIYQDPRIPIDAYRVTFVKSLAVVPIRRDAPIGAIGVYWDHERIVSEEELAMLQAVADSVSIAMENVALYDQLQGKVRELQESNHELSRFTWVASHDLQEPLRTITTQVELLARRCGSIIDEQARNYIQAATGSARRLQNLIEDLLVHARVEHSENFKPVAMEHVVRDVLQDMQPTLMEHGAEINVAPNLPLIMGDQRMLARVVQNLIANAIKFAKPGEKSRVNIACMRNEGQWHFTVQDAGIGIEADQSERIFGMFQRIHPQAVYPGSGIGLATCKKIVELHQGNIWAESQPGKGSVFHIMLPVAGELAMENHA